MNTPDPNSPYATGGPIHPGTPTRVGPAETVTPPPKRKSRLPLILLAAAGAVLLLVLTVVITLGASSGSGQRGGAPSAWDREQSANAAPVDAGEQGVPTDEPTTTSPTPAVKDFALRAKVTDKKCYGYGVGCSVTIKVQAEYAGPDLSPDDTWEITYEVRGVENGPVIGSFEMTGDTYTVNEEYVDTKSSKSVITIKVTSVEKVGL